MFQPGLDFSNIHIVEIFDYYDMPVLFHCEIETVNYLCVLVSTKMRIETWLCVEMSAYRLEEVKGGKIDLHDAFAQAENGTVYLVDVEIGTSVVSKVTGTASHLLSEDLLPISGEYLYID